jgi:putative acetyltransferase
MDRNDPGDNGVNEVNSGALWSFLDQRTEACYPSGTMLKAPASAVKPAQPWSEWEAQVLIRSEMESDIQAIAEVTQAAFATCPYSHQTEQFILAALRAAGALSVSLVAELEGQVVGHVAFSPVTISDGNPHWYGVGPVSVLPRHQRQGIGSALLCEGFSRLQTPGARGCVLVGEPAYYQRFGFRNRPTLTLEGVPPQYFLALPFGDQIPTGAVVFHPAFSARA